MRHGLILLLLTLLSGCALLGAPDAPAFVQLHISGAGATIAPATPTGRSILIVTPTARPGYGGSRFAYIEQDHKLDYYGRHVWADDPGRLIRVALVDALERSGAFDAVVVSPSPANADFRLDLELVSLHQDYRRAGGVVMTMAMRAQLIRLDGRSVVATRSFEFEEPTTRGPVAGAAAADRALARMLEALTAFVAEAARAVDD